MMGDERSDVRRAVRPLRRLMALVCVAAVSTLALGWYVVRAITQSEIRGERMSALIGEVDASVTEAASAAQRDVLRMRPGAGRAAGDRSGPRPWLGRAGADLERLEDDPDFGGVSGRASVLVSRLAGLERALERCDELAATVADASSRLRAVERGADESFGRLAEHVSIVTGRQRLEAYRARTARGDDGDAPPANDARVTRSLERFRWDLHTLGSIVEQIRHEDHRTRLVSIRDNRVSELVTRLDQEAGRISAVAPGVGARIAPMLDGLTDAILGAGYTIDTDHQSLVLGEDGLIGARGDYLDALDALDEALVHADRLNDAFESLAHALLRKAQSAVVAEHDAANADVRTAVVVGSAGGVLIACVVASIAVWVGRVAKRDAVERALGHEALERSEHRLSEITRQNRSIVWEIDLGGRIRYISDNVSRIIGHTPAELIGRSRLFDLIPESHRETLGVQLGERFGRGETISGLELPAAGKSGREHWFLLNATPITGADGLIIGYRGSATDITDRRRSELALIENRAFLGSLLDAIPVPVFYQNARGEYLGSNHAFETLFGCRGAEIVGKTAPELWADGLCRQCVRRDREVFLGEGTQRYESTLEFPDGRSNDVVFVKASYADSTGRAQGVIGALLDVTELKRAEQRIRTLSQAVEQTASSVVITDTTGRIEYVNPAFAELTGYSPDEVIGENPRILKSGEMPGEVYREMWQTLLAGRTWRGELLNRRRGGELFWEMASIAPVKNANGAITHYVAVKDDITDRKQMEDELRAAAMTDPLTGLANRTHLCDLIQQAVDRAAGDPARSVAVLFIDFDRFKTINDCLGHDVGDELLVQISRRLERCVRGGDGDRPGDTVARFGGDEFVIVTEGGSPDANATDLAVRLLRDLADEYVLGGHRVCSTASIGIVCTGGARQPLELLRDADTAMYEAKSAGRNCYRVFDESMQQSVRRRLTIESDLRHAESNGQFGLMYQPIVDLERREVQSYEVLVRWEHPVLGTISPSEFIPIAEESGQVLGIGEWVLETACAKLAQWRRELGPGFTPGISVNLSRNQLAMPGLIEYIERTIETHGIPPALLQFEVTETAIMQNIKEAVRVLKDVKRVGVQLAMDDFGTGHSSLACLHEMPFDVLKIDRSFITDASQRRDYAAIIHSIVNLAHNLGITIVAEGIENGDQLILLQALDCNAGQGYLFSRPLDARDVPGFGLSFERGGQGNEAA